MAWIASRLYIAVAVIAFTVSGVFAAPAPSIQLNDVEGVPFKLGDLRGKVVLLNFWATYCVPCLTELEAYRGLQQRRGAEGLQIVAVSVDAPQTVARARSFAKARAFPFPMILDPEQEAYRLYDVSVMPTTILIDQEGQIVYRKEGFQPGDEADLERRVQALLAVANPVDTSAAEVDEGGLLPDAVAEHVTLSGSNFLRANYGKENRNLPASNGWLEDWFDFRLAGSGLSYQARFRAYQFLRDLPGSRENTVRDPTDRVVKQTFAYESDRADIQAGNFYGTLNRGLVLRMFEDRQARIDKDVEGVMATLKFGQESGRSQRGRFSVFGGKTYARFTDLYALDADEDNLRNTHLQGVEGEWEVWTGVRLGAQALEAFRDSWHIRMLAGNGEFLYGPTTVYVGYAGLTGQDAFNYPNDFHGRALYGSVSENWGRLELGAEYKYYYNYDLGFAEPPSLLKYHTYRLMARDLLFSNNQNEQGVQVHGTWRFHKNEGGDAAHGQDFYAINISTLESHPERNTALLIHHVALPYLDVDQSVQFSRPDGTALSIDLDWNKQRRFEAGVFEDIEATTLGTTITRPLPGPWNVMGEAEVQRRSVEYRSLVPGNATLGTPGSVGPVDSREEPWLGVISATLGRNSAWSFTLDYEMTTSDRAAETGWTSGYFTVSAIAGQQISVWFGQRQERVVCSGGSCRVEPAFEGGELTWITHF